MKILVMGTGGVGGYFGAKLARAGEELTFVARGEHLSAMHARGLRIRSRIEGEFSVAAAATDDLTTAGPADLVLLCVKSYDTEAAARVLGPAVGPETAVVSLQNGVDNEEKITAIVGPGHVLGGAAYVFANIEAPGVIQHSLGGRIIFGELDGKERPRARLILEALEGAGIPVELTPDIRRVLWEKYLFIVAQSSMTALTRCPIGVVRSLPEPRTMYRLILEELAVLAKAEGVGLAVQVVETILAATDSLAPTVYSSLYDDLTRGKRLEIEALQGHAVRLGERHGIPTPMCFAAYAGLMPYVNGPPG